MNDQGDNGSGTKNGKIKEMPTLYSFSKILADYLFSIIILLLLSPFLLMLAVVIRLSVKGPVI
jgi:lipopolysaccharide/colanic/teichoic acid biosynthesis glycosyltransferase